MDTGVRQHIQQSQVVPCLLLRPLLSYYHVIAPRVCKLNQERIVVKSTMSWGMIGHREDLEGVTIPEGSFHRLPTETDSLGNSKLLISNQRLLNLATNNLHLLWWKMRSSFCCLYLTTTSEQDVQALVSTLSPTHKSYQTPVLLGATEVAEENEQEFLIVDPSNMKGMSNISHLHHLRTRGALPTPRRSSIWLQPF